MSEKVTQVGNGLVSLGIGALVLFAGLLVLLDAAVVALAEVFAQDQLWLSPLIIGGVVAIIGALMLLAGRRKFKAQNLKPQRTIDELRRDKEQFREKLS